MPCVFLGEMSALSTVSWLGKGLCAIAVVSEWLLGQYYGLLFALQHPLDQPLVGQACYEPLSSFMLSTVREWCYRCTSSDEETDSEPRRVQSQT